MHMWWQRTWLMHRSLMHNNIIHNFIVFFGKKWERNSAERMDRSMHVLDYGNLHSAGEMIIHNNSWQEPFEASFKLNKFVHSCNPFLTIIASQTLIAFGKMPILLGYSTARNIHCSDPWTQNALACPDNDRELQSLMCPLMDILHDSWWTKLFKFIRGFSSISSVHTKFRNRQQMRCGLLVFSDNTVGDPSGPSSHWSHFSMTICVDAQSTLLPFPGVSHVVAHGLTMHLFILTMTRSSNFWCALWQQMFCSTEDEPNLIWL